MDSNHIIYGPKPVGPIIMVILAIIFVFVILSGKTFLSVKTIISRTRGRFSNNHKSQNEEDIEIGIANTKIRQGRLRQRNLSI